MIEDIETAGGIAVHSTISVTNIYGYSLDITDQVKNAAESEMTHIEMARIKPGMYSGDSTGELVPEVVYKGETLENGVDYILNKVNDPDTFDKTGAFEVQLTGKGRFTGRTVMTFNIVLPEDEATQAVNDALAAVEEAQAEVDALSEDAAADDIKTAYEKLVQAQNALTDAQETLETTKDILSAEEQAELEDKIAEQEGQIEELNN